MKLFKLAHDINIKKALHDLEVDHGALTILASKMHYHLIKIENLHVAAANILKQDALSIGAELATPKGVITCDTKYVDVILMGTSKHLKILSKKELAQPFGLKEVAKLLSHFIKETSQEIEIMGIINANDDSFFSKSRFSSDQALVKIQEMINDGATIIDIGAVSSRPNADTVSETVELERVKSIIDTIYAQKLFEKARFSIDSYTPSVLEYALSHGFTIVNDITGLADDKVCEIAAKHKAQVVIMHMQGNPQTMQKQPEYENIITDISDFFTERIQKALSFGIKDIILDVGIGFGKTLNHNLMLIKHLEHFKSLGYPLLVGGSRKSMINDVLTTPTQDRLAATLALHLEALNRGACIIRCHDVKEHTQAFSITKALKELG